MTSCFKVFKYLVETYTADYFIAKIDAKILCFTRPCNALQQSMYKP